MSNALLDVLQGRFPERRPIWFMRQAGRYLPEYREVRSKAGSFLKLCYNPALAAEVTVQPLRRFDLDAAILFADILVVPQAMGLDLRFEEGEGPVLSKVFDLDGVARLGAVGSTDYVKCVCETVGRVRGMLSSKTALIGFCGGPWTVASYMVEGGSSERTTAKLAAYNDAPWFVAMIEKLVIESVDYLSAQIQAGAEAVQIFDSWAGELAGIARERYVVTPLVQMCQMLRELHPSVPVIVFARGLGRVQGRVADASGASAVGVETDEQLKLVLRDLPQGCAVQGNLDPVMLLADDQGLRREVRRIADSVPMHRHIFNLGHGIREQTEPEKILSVVDEIRAFDLARG